MFINHACSIGWQPASNGTLVSDKPIAAVKPHFPRATFPARLVELPSYDQPLFLRAECQHRHEWIVQPRNDLQLFCGKPYPQRDRKPYCPGHLTTVSQVGMLLDEVAGQLMDAILIHIQTAFPSPHQLSRHISQRSGFRHCALQENVLVDRPRLFRDLSSVGHRDCIAQDTLVTIGAHQLERETEQRQQVVGLSTATSYRDIPEASRPRVL